MELKFLGCLVAIINLFIFSVFFFAEVEITLKAASLELNCYLTWLLLLSNSNQTTDNWFIQLFPVYIYLVQWINDQLVMQIVF